MELTTKEQIARPLHLESEGCSQHAETKFREPGSSNIEKRDHMSEYDITAMTNDIITASAKARVAQINIDGIRTMMGQMRMMDYERNVINDRLTEISERIAFMETTLKDLLTEKYVSKEKG